MDLNKTLIKFSVVVVALIIFIYVYARPNEVSLTLINNSDINLIGLPAHSSLAKTDVYFPHRAYAYVANYGIENTNIRECFSVGINNFTLPYVQTRIIQSNGCTLSVSTQKNTNTDYIIILSNAS
jgi:hypothetical protein